MPLFGLGNITLTIGTLCWTLLGSQGRYRLATFVAFCGSWGVTLPLAALSSAALHFSLTGQTGAVVIGYMISGTVNAFFLFCSDWEYLSQQVIESHDHDVGMLPCSSTDGDNHDKNHQQQPTTSSGESTTSRDADESEGVEHHIKI